MLDRLEAISDCFGAISSAHETQVAAPGRSSRWADAARLAGASAAVHEQIGAPPWESVTAMHERALAGARQALGSARFAAHVAEGHRLSAEDTVTRLAADALADALR
jgi:hypothetical protein